MKRMLRAWPVAVVSTALLAVIPRDARPSPYSVEPCLQSRLCNGLVDHFSFEEGSDSARYGVFGSVLHEVPGANLGNTAGKIGNAVNFTGTASTDWLWSSTFVPPMTSSWSATFWFRAASLPAEGGYVVLFGRTASSNVGTEVTLGTSGGTTHLCVWTNNKEGTSPTPACDPMNLSANTTYFGAVGVGDPDDTPGQTQEWASLNAGTKTPTTLTFIPASGLSHFRVGQEPTNGKGAVGTRTYTGWLDELTLYSRNIGPTDIAMAYNSGSGRAYPFVTE